MDETLLSVRQAFNSLDRALININIQTFFILLCIAAVQGILLGIAIVLTRNIRECFTDFLEDFIETFRTIRLIRLNRRAARRHNSSYRE